jgi:uncharacterized protein
VPLPRYDRLTMSGLATYDGGCHCGRVRFRVTGDLATATICNCSICRRKGFVHLIVPPAQFELLSGAEALSVYTFNTGTARHQFCSSCGMHPFYVPRSDPDKIDVNVRCLEGVDLASLPTHEFDGANWEEAIQGDLGWREPRGAGRVTTAIWRRLDVPGHDSCRVIDEATGPRLEGTAVFLEEGRAWRLDYEIRCDQRWHTRQVAVTGWAGDRGIDVRLTADGAGAWFANGVPCPQVAGCLDVDLGFTPATNLLSLRRLRLQVGQRAQVQAAWLPFPSTELTRLDQAYERTSTASYAYHSVTTGFRGEIQVDEAGLPTTYPTLWQRET